MSRACSGTGTPWLVWWHHPDATWSDESRPLTQQQERLSYRSEPERMAKRQVEIVELQEQMEIAVTAIRTAALKLLEAGRVHPHVLVWPRRGLRANWAPARRWPAGCPWRRCWTTWPRSRA